MFYGGAAGGGKALALDTPLPTPDGWVTMGDVQVGDTLFDERGHPCRVLYASELMQDHAVYEVEFDDGSVIVADGEHRWLTLTVADRAAAIRRTEAFRTQRRESRPSRATGTKSAAFTAMLTARNRANPPPTQVAPEGAIRTTLEIAATLRSGPAATHSVPTAGALDCPPSDLPIDPYVFGAWLGDGNSRGIGFTCADEGILAEIRAAGYAVSKRSLRYEYGILGIGGALNRLGVYVNKHVPPAYLRASIAQRLSLVQGLMDTDGYAAADGGCEFTSTRLRLAEGMCELLLSLGIKATVRQGRATLNGRDCGSKYRIIFTTTLPVFRLARKRDRQAGRTRPTQDRRFIVAVRPTARVPVRCVAVSSPSHLYLAGRSMIPTHNTDAALMLGYRACTTAAGSRVLLLRRTYADLNKGGSAIDRSHELFAGLARYNGSLHQWTFPNGSRFEFGHLQHEHAVSNYQGSQYDLVIPEEVTQFSEYQYLFLFSRLRSRHGGRPRFRPTGNPGGIGHRWAKARFVDPAPPETPFPTTNDAGVVVGTGRFIPARLRDNAALLAADPDYERRLGALPEALRAALLDGSWDVFQGQVFAAWRRETHVVPTRALPPGWRRVVGLDYGTHRPFAAVWLARGDRLDDDPPAEAPCDRDRAHLYAYRDLERAGLTDERMAHATARASQGERIEQYLADPNSFWLRNNQTGQSPAALFLAAGVRLVPANNDRIMGKRAVETAIGRCACGVPRLRAFDRCTALIRALPALPYDPHDVEDVDTRAEGDDIYDATRYALMGPRPTSDKPYATVTMGGQHAYE